MISLRKEKIEDIGFARSTVSLVGACMEAKGKQDLWIRQKPEIVNALREQAMVYSAESSNRIEGVTIDPDRLEPIVLGDAEPRDRSEQEVYGYRRALNWIFSREQGVGITPRIIQHLHSLAQGSAYKDAGQWKKEDNEIVEVSVDGKKRVRFKPTPAKETTAAVKELCDAYDQICKEGEIPVPITVATFILDFLCIHPFRDGNGRVSRLLTTLLLLQHGYEVPRFISLERQVEGDKKIYYDVLGECSKGWHKGYNKLQPWWDFFLDILHLAYTRLEKRVQGIGRTPKSELVRHVIENQIDPFTLAEIKAQCPTISVQLVKKVLGNMKEEGKVKLEGRGRGARWELH